MANRVTTLHDIIEVAVAYQIVQVVGFCLLVGWLVCVGEDYQLFPLLLGSCYLLLEILELFAGVNCAANIALIVDFCKPSVLLCPYRCRPCVVSAGIRSIQQDDR